MDHSPAPWKAHVRQSELGVCILDAENRVIVLMKDIHDDERRLANARLVAAAPAMLGVLRDCIELMNADSPLESQWDATIDEAREIIAKATGADQ